MSGKAQPLKIDRATIVAVGESAVTVQEAEGTVQAIWRRELPGLGAKVLWNDFARPAMPAELRALAAEIESALVRRAE